MVKGIFWRENYSKDKKIKIPNRESPGERRNLSGDMKAKSKYRGFTKFQRVIYI